MAKKKSEKTNEILEILASNEIYDYMGKALPRLIGNYRDLKPVSERMEQELRACGVVDLVDGLTGDAFTDDIINTFMKEEKNEYATTHLYLYCNWRAWATYENDVEKAKKYQAVCDKIDGYVFDNWDKEKLAYFIKETD